MSIENNEAAVEVAPVENTDNLNEFEALLYGQSESVPEEATSDDEVQTDVEDAGGDAEPEDTQDEADTLDDEGEPEKPAEKPAKKNRFQERIDELTQGRREAERRAEALEARLAALEEAKQNPEPTKAPETAAEGPDPYGKNEDGSDIYPLGEYDPAYLRDYVKHLTAVEREAAKAQEAKAVEQSQIEQERQALQASWESKLEPAQERYPDFLQKGQELVASFEGIDPNYGEYLSTQIMDLDYGTDVLYYLATHPEEAKAIVDSGARKATVALGRLDAKFGFAEEEKQKVRTKHTQAPPPPPQNRGAAPVADIADDTDDLDAFARKLYGRK